MSIDEFGTGYSSLSYLHRLPVDTLKVERSFVSQMSQNDENREIVRTIVTLARSLGLKVVAEGIETAEQMTQLLALECEGRQAYLFSRALEAAVAGELLDRELLERQCGVPAESFIPEVVEVVGDALPM